MAIQKQPVKVNFAQGENSKLDPWQLPNGNFQVLNNMTFNTVGMMSKRAGYAQVGTLGPNNYKNVSTLNGNLIVTGENIASYNEPLNTYNTTGTLLPVNLSTFSVSKNSYNAVNCDSVYYQAPGTNGMVLTAWTQQSTYRNTTTDTSYYQFSDAVTGQVIVGPIAIESGAGVSGVQVNLLSTYFIISYQTPVTGSLSSINLRYIAIPVSTPAAPIAPVTLVVGSYSETCYDCAVYNNSIYFQHQSFSSGLMLVALNNSLVVTHTALVPGTTPSTSSGPMATLVDPSAGSIYFVFDIDGSMKYVVYDGALNPILATTVITGGTTIMGITGSFVNSHINLIFEVANLYSYSAVWSSAAQPTDFVATCTLDGLGNIGPITTVCRGVGLASKSVASADSTDLYFLAAYGASNIANLQPSYFLMNKEGVVLAKLAYSNAAGYLGGTIAEATITPLDVAPTIPKILSDATLGLMFPYLVGFQASPVNKQISGTVTGIYEQIGVNFAIMQLNSTLNNKETAQSLHITGGLLNQYDGANLVEDGFNVWPDDIGAAVEGSGSFPKQQYYYQVTYEWTDNQGILQRSAPSTATGVDVTTSVAGITLNIPTLRLTRKKNVRIVIYRWSTDLPIFYQITSITNPLLNDTTVDSVSYTDTIASAFIAGNTIIYTNGGVVENIPPPSCFAPTLYNSRMFVISAEDQNMILYSKQVIEATPVEFSQFFTLFISANYSSTGAATPLKALSVMDDKLILFKRSAISYIIGTGPDNTGANNNFSDPTSISATIGCTNNNSIIPTSMGLIFQASNGAGIWLLGRDLSTKYIGAPVSQYNSSNVLSATLIPGTNQVRFHMDNGIIIMYDYFVDQWGTFTNAANNFGSSSVIYQGLHTYLIPGGQVEQETPGIYLDQADPVVMNFTSAWIAMAGLQGYQRSYFIYMLAKYISAHTLTVSIAYDYNPTNVQVITINPNTPSNPTPNNGDLEQWRIFLSQQRCQAFQITLQENYTGTAGAGLTISGLNIIAGFKSIRRTMPASLSVGGGGNNTGGST